MSIYTLCSSLPPAHPEHLPGDFPPRTRKYNRILEAKMQHPVLSPGGGTKPVTARQAQRYGAASNPFLGRLGEQEQYEM